ncbi:hypothetical protein D3C81_1631870 [compost metagenome]
MLSTSTLSDGYWLRSTRVSSRPFMSGRLMSTSSRSGWQRPTISMASAPFSASPTISRGDITASSALIPSRTRE